MDTMKLLLWGNDCLDILCSCVQGERLELGQLQENYNVFPGYSQAFYQSQLEVTGRYNLPQQMAVS